MSSSSSSRRPSALAVAAAAVAEAASPADPATAPSLLNLPGDALLHILLQSALAPRDLVALQLTCKQLAQAAAKDQRLWATQIERWRGARASSSCVPPPPSLAELQRVWGSGVPLRALYARLHTLGCWPEGVWYLESCSDGEPVGPLGAALSVRANPGELHLEVYLPDASPELPLIFPSFWGKVEFEPGGGIGGGKVRPRKTAWGREVRGGARGEASI